MDEDDRDGLFDSAALGPSRSSVVPVGDGWQAELIPGTGGALLRIVRSTTEPTLEITVSMTKDGPVVRARAAALEIESDGDLIARCDRFRVEARDSIDLRAGGTLRAEGRRVALEATHGSIKAHANDDVQLLGENVLLNCERSPPVPKWALPTPLLPAPTVPAQESSGDAALAEHLRKLP
jgi:hypothetical protein